jgi:hypothetical protein
LQLDSFPVLQRMLLRFRAWEADAQRLTKDPSGNPLKPSYASLAAAAASARVWPIASPLRSFIDDAAQKTGALLAVLSSSPVPAAK